MSSRRTILAVQIDNIRLTEATARAEQMLRGHSFHHVVTPGPEFLMEAQDHPAFKKILNSADLSLPDGMGLKVAGWLTGRSFQSRVTGVDFSLAALQICNQHQLRVFLYGGQPGIAERAAQKIIHQFPNVIVAGYETDWRGSWQRLHEQRVVEKIHLARPHLLLVGLGAPKQELWIHKHRQALHHVRLAIGVGRTLDYLAGETPRAPKLIRQLGFEWLMTYLQAGKYYQPELRRQRVRNATWHFMHQVLRHPHD